MKESCFSLSEYSPQAVVLGNGVFPSERLVERWISRSNYFVCCDGAAAGAVAHGLVPDAIVGDGDSITDDLKRRFAGILHLEGEQDYNDQTKAVRFLSGRGMKRIAILGSTGRREDHSLGNISMLVYYLQRGITAVMPTEYGTFVPCCNDVCLRTAVGQQVSVFNFNAVGIRSQNLKYGCYDFNMLWQGTLNEATAGCIRIFAKGYYLVYLANV